MNHHAQTTNDESRKMSRNKNLTEKQDAALSACAEIANRAIAEHIESSMMSILTGIKAGLALEQAKEVCPRGSYQDWVEANIKYTYQHSMRLRHLANAFCNHHGLNLQQAMKLCYGEDDPGYKGMLKKAQVFIGDRNQADLFAEYGIAVQRSSSPRQIAGGLPASAAQDEGEDPPIVRQSRRVWQGIRSALCLHVQRKKTYANLPREELSALYQDLKDFTREVKRCLDQEK